MSSMEGQMVNIIIAQSSNARFNGGYVRRGPC